MRLALALLAAAVPAAPAADVSVVDKPPTAPANTRYVGNRPPLQPGGLLRLPPGSVRPAGWLRTMLRSQADGFHGHLQEISKFLVKADNAWLAKDGRGKQGWEEVPYWLKGYLNCGYALGDEKIVKDAMLWVEGAIASQQADGWFGPGDGRTGEATDLVGRDDLWPNMVMLFILQDYYEVSGDKRVPELMRRYFKYLEAVPEAKFLNGYWPSMRGGDQIASTLWLYNRTGEPWLLDLARKTHRKTARWDQGLVNKHNVNVAQAFREPATFWQLSGSPRDLLATEFVWQDVRARYGRVPGGMFGADENARDGYTGPRQMIETCGVVEEMLSDELLVAITGETRWADRCEDAAFNSLPAAFTPDMTGLRYLTAPNMPRSDHASKAPGIENGGDMCGMNPHHHRCCQHNSGHGWPYLSHHLWYAAAGDGLAAYLYGPCSVTAAVAGGVKVTVEEDTKYPFGETIKFTVNPEKPVRFPLYLRIPEWCKAAGVAVNDAKADVALPAGKVARVEREWKAGDVVTLSLPMTVGVKTWADNRNTVSVSRGPLTYSLRIPEKKERYAGTDRWPAYDLFPAGPWNYGLDLDPADPTKGLTVQRGDWPADDRPFGDQPPVSITAPARAIPNWTLDSRGLVREVIAGPVRSDQPRETVTLVPMGAARLRVSAFPRIDNERGKEWPAPPPAPVSPGKVTASHCNETDTLDALWDGEVGAKSNDHGVGRMTWWPRKGTAEWVQYEFPKPATVRGCEVMWYDDTPGGGCKLPAGWRLEYKDGDAWKPVPGQKAEPAEADKPDRLTCDPVTTLAVRLAVQLRPGFSGGVLEWKVHTGDK